MKYDKDKAWEWVLDHSEELFVASCSVAAVLWFYGFYRAGVKVGKNKGAQEMVKYMAKNYPAEFKSMLEKDIVKAMKTIIK